MFVINGSTVPGVSHFFSANVWENMYKEIIRQQKIYRILEIKQNTYSQFALW